MTSAAPARKASTDDSKTLREHIMIVVVVGAFCLNQRVSSRPALVCGVSRSMSATAKYFSRANSRARTASETTVGTSPFSERSCARPRCTFSSPSTTRTSCPSANAMCRDPIAASRRYQALLSASRSATRGEHERVDELVVASDGTGELPLSDARLETVRETLGVAGVGLGAHVLGVAGAVD